MNLVQKPIMPLSLAGCFLIFNLLLYLPSVLAEARVVSLKTCPKVIRSMAVDSRQRLWIGTFGKGLWVKEGKNIRQFRNEELQLPFPMINNLLVSGNLLYIATAGGGIHCLNTDRDEFLNLNQHPDYKKLHGLIKTSSGQIIAGSVGNGLCILTTDTWKPIAEKQPSSLAWVNAIAEWNNSLWIGTSAGLYTIRQSEKSVKADFAGLNRGVNHMIEHKNKLFIGTTSRGVFICEPEKSPYQLLQTHGNVHLLIEFKDKLFSIGQESLFEIENDKAKLIETEFDGAKCAVTQKEKNLLVGTLNGRIYKSVDGKTFSLYLQLTENGFEEPNK